MLLPAHSGLGAVTPGGTRRMMIADISGTGELSVPAAVNEVVEKTDSSCCFTTPGQLPCVFDVVAEFEEWINGGTLSGLDAAGPGGDDGKANRFVTGHEGEASALLGPLGDQGASVLLEHKLAASRSADEEAVPGTSYSAGSVRGRGIIVRSRLPAGRLEE